MDAAQDQRAVNVVKKWDSYVMIGSVFIWNEHFHHASVAEPGVRPKG